ncbi:hypothetical protein VFPFJ_07375 [Purpureocillium lilacinum]|uniref:Uncharacterized protein n=1 Tax=Purpureocillium lilacinum TaxID=33203 RepID=A0A179HHH2_PURLI|nr:hypothetical protein VFPFJ_07375 [Purpureocillium lilacinum]OAQ88910.1 hypothetical protein VFPFJ_07375 [Purpureocillium lilacinum]
MDGSRSRRRQLGMGIDDCDKSPCLTRQTRGTKMTTSPFSRSRCTRRQMHARYQLRTRVAHGLLHPSAATDQQDLDARNQGRAASDKPHTFQRERFSTSGLLVHGGSPLSSPVS